MKFEPKKITPYEHLVTLPFFSLSPPEGVYAARTTPSASPNALKTRTRRSRAPRRVWRDFRDFTTRRPPGTRRRSRKRPFQISSLTTVSSGRLKSRKSRETRRGARERRVRVFGIFGEALGVVRAAYTPSGGEAEKNDRVTKCSYGVIFLGSNFTICPA